MQAQIVMYGFHQEMYGFHKMYLENNLETILQQKLSINVSVQPYQGLKSLKKYLESSYWILKISKTTRFSSGGLPA